MKLFSQKILFLRGQVPTDRPKEQIMFDRLEDCDDMWTQLAYHLSKDDYGEIWYWVGKRTGQYKANTAEKWGEKRTVQYKENFVERWIRDFRICKVDFKPTVIFARGGFKEYDPILKKNPQAFKIYYGAGYRRTPPKKQFNDFDLILVDTPKQLKKAQEDYPNIKSKLFIKPVAENIFKPVYKPDGSLLDKPYDVILVGNYNKGVDKGHDFAFNALPRNMQGICVGKVPPDVQLSSRCNIIYTGWLPRRKLPYYYARSKVAIICCGKEDSCPRVIPEALACGCPILVLKRVNLWQEKYITPLTGRITTRGKFPGDLKTMVSEYGSYLPYKYYKEHLSLERSIVGIL